MLLVMTLIINMYFSPYRLEYNDGEKLIEILYFRLAVMRAADTADVEGTSTRTYFPLFYLLCHQVMEQFCQWVSRVTWITYKMNYFDNKATAI